VDEGLIVGTRGRGYFVCIDVNELQFVLRVKVCAGDIRVSIQMQPISMTLSDMGIV